MQRDGRDREWGEVCYVEEKITQNKIQSRSVLGMNENGKVREAGEESVRGKLQKMSSEKCVCVLGVSENLGSFTLL